MGFDRFIRLTETIPFHLLKSICFSGGDILILPDAERMIVEDGSQPHASLCVYTNGAALDGALVGLPSERIREHPARLIECGNG